MQTVSCFLPPLPLKLATRPATNKALQPLWIATLRMRPSCGYARASASPTLAAATASTSSFGSTLSGTVNDPFVKPKALAVTSMVFGAEDASP